MDAIIHNKIITFMYKKKLNLRSYPCDYSFIEEIRVPPRHLMVIKKKNNINQHHLQKLRPIYATGEAHILSEIPLDC